MTTRQRNHDRTLRAVSLLGTTVTIGLLLASLAWALFGGIATATADAANLVFASLVTTADALGMVAVVIGLGAPVALGAALYLEEYAPDHWVTHGIALNIDELARLPGIVWSVTALALILRLLPFDGGGTVLVATLSLVALPRLVQALRAALRSIPEEERTAAWALGATRWQVVWHHVLPLARGRLIGALFDVASYIIGAVAPLLLLVPFAVPSLGADTSAQRPPWPALELFAGFIESAPTPAWHLQMVVLLLVAVVLRLIGLASARGSRDA